MDDVKHFALRLQVKFDMSFKFFGEKGYVRLLEKRDWIIMT